MHHKVMQVTCLVRASKRVLGSSGAAVATKRVSNFPKSQQSFGIFPNNKMAVTEGIKAADSVAAPADAPVKESKRKDKLKSMEPSIQVSYWLV